jgi:hypothetical protein
MFRILTNPRLTASLFLQSHARNQYRVIARNVNDLRWNVRLNRRASPQSH